MKVLIYMYALAPYKIDFCNELGKKVDLTVLFETGLTKNRDKNWQNSIRCKNFKPIFLSNKKNIFKPTILKILKENKFDIIDIGVYTTLNGMLAINYLSNKKIPFIFSIDGGIINKDNKIKYLIKRHFISKANFYLSSGKISDEYLIHYGANEKNIYHYPFTSLRKKDILEKNITLVEKRRYKKELKIKYEKFILCIGQMIYRKGYDILLNSAHLIDNNVGIYIIGGYPTPELKEIKEKNNLNNVHFLEFLQKEDLKKYFLAADLFVFPTRYDIWGLVTNEAMAYGLPVITSDKCVSGLELIENGINGYIAKSENGVDLCQKINLILNDKKLAQKMAKNNLVKIKNYTIENMAKSHYEIFCKIVEKKEV